jgi:hypothetical protein
VTVQCTLREKMFQLLKAMECANPGFNLHLALFDEPYHNGARGLSASVLCVGAGLLSSGHLPVVL